MKITLKQTKPRNPVAVPARKRHAGKHGGYRPERSERRVAKQEVIRYLLGRRDDLS